MTNLDPAAIEAMARGDASVTMEHDKSLSLAENLQRLRIARMEAALAALRQAGWSVRGPGQRWRHKKRGTVYTEIGTAELQMATDLVDGSFLTIYQGDDGKLWARQEDEFHDGRFETVTPPEPRDD